MQLSSRSPCASIIIVKPARRVGNQINKAWNQPQIARGRVFDAPWNVLQGALHQKLCQATIQRICQLNSFKISAFQMWQSRWVVLTTQLLWPPARTKRDFSGTTACSARWCCVYKNNIVMFNDMVKEGPSMLCRQLHIANSDIRVKTVGFMVYGQMLKTTVLETFTQNGSPCTYFHDQRSAPFCCPRFNAFNGG